MRILVLLMSCLVSAFVSGQEACGTYATEEQLEFIESIDQYSSGRIDAGGLVSIPLTIHVIRKTDGTGGLTENSVNAAVNNVNQYYQNANIIFFIKNGIKYIDDDDFYDLKAVDEGKLAVPNDVPKTINVYLSNTISSNGGGLCGYTRFPPSEDRVFVAYGCLFGGTFEHEIGHYFTLFHTHGKTNTGRTDELVDGSNCTSAGDNLCDTPADPNLSGLVSGDCKYTGILTDANGDIYLPRVDNIMAYSLDQCQDYFSPGQYNKIRNGFENGRAYLDFTSESFTALFSSDFSDICPGQAVNFNASAFGAIDYSWSFPGGTPSTSKALKPRITYNESGKYDVTLTVTNNSGERIVVDRPGFIKVEDPLEFQVVGELQSSFGSTEFEEGWLIDNPDRSITFEITSVDVDEEVSSYSLWMNNRGYVSDISRNEDILQLPSFPGYGIKGLSVSFEYAYSFLPAKFEGGIITPARYDSLMFILEYECLGDAELLWKNGGAGLASVDPIQESFIPVSSEWKSETINYTTDVELDYLRLTLKSISYNGNNLYIDNLKIMPDYSVQKPTSLRVLSQTAEYVELTWFDNARNEDGYLIERKVNDGSFQEIGTVDRNIKIFRDTSVPGGSTLTYRVKGITVDGNYSESTNELIVSSVLANENARSLIVYPNPVSEQITIESLDNRPFDLVDITGKIIQSGQLLSGSTFLTIPDTYHGIVILRIQRANSKWESFKLVKE